MTVFYPWRVWSGMEGHCLVFALWALQWPRACGTACRLAVCLVWLWFACVTGHVSESSHPDWSLCTLVFWPEVSPALLCGLEYRTHGITCIFLPGWVSQLTIMSSLPCVCRREWPSTVSLLQNYLSLFDSRHALNWVHPCYIKIEVF